MKTASSVNCVDSDLGELLLKNIKVLPILKYKLPELGFQLQEYVWSKTCFVIRFVMNEYIHNDGQ